MKDVKSEYQANQDLARFTRDKLNKPYVMPMKDRKHKARPGKYSVGNVLSTTFWLALCMAGTYYLMYLYVTNF